MKCDTCNKRVTRQNSVITPHRVVGEGFDVEGGPAEVYCPTCASKKIYDLRGHISELHSASADKEEAVQLIADAEEPSWWSLWVSKHSFQSILGEIQDLSKHPLKPKFTTGSIGRALSARLRDRALESAIMDAPIDPSDTVAFQRSIPAPEPGAKS